MSERECVIDPLFFERVIIKLLFNDEKKRDKIIPFLKPKLFNSFEVQQIIKHVQRFIKTYGTFPTFTEFKVEIEQKDLHDYLLQCMNTDTTQISDSHLLAKVESFFKQNIAFNAIVDAKIQLEDNNIEKMVTYADQLREAISFSFNSDVGLDVFSEEGEEEMFNHLHDNEKVIPTGIEYFDDMIEGGFHEKSLSLFLAETNLGKSLIMAGLAANQIILNKNVLYVTLEMSRHKMTERVLANCFDLDMEQLKLLTREKFHAKFERLRERVKHKLVVLEYPTRTITSSTLRQVYKELEVKKGFTPDVVYVDYMGIMLPVQTRADENSYSEQKRVAEELRGLAVETGVPWVSAVQTNRGGFDSTNIDLKDTADSIGTAATADVIIGVTQSDEQRQFGKYSWIILKNRYGVNKRRTTIGVDYNKMRVFADESVSQKEPEERSQATRIVDEASKLALNVTKNSRAKERKQNYNFE